MRSDGIHDFERAARAIREAYTDGFADARAHPQCTSGECWPQSSARTAALAATGGHVEVANRD